MPGEAAGEGFTWDEHDRHDPSWWPQGIACVRGGEVLLVSWYAKRRWLIGTEIARISVIDRTDSEHPRYRHVLLVAPRRPLGFAALRTVPVHAGGIAVYGDHLYVADTLFGVRVFRLSDVLRRPRRQAAPPPGTETSDGRAARSSRIFARRSGGYEYVLPELLAFRVPLRAGLRRLRYSFLSVGEVAGEPTLVVGEYRRKGEAPRLARYRVDPATGLPGVDGSGRCAPLEVHADQPNRMQGAAVHGSTWFLSASAGETTPGDLYVGAPGAWQRHRRVLPSGPEDLDWSRPGEELWCVSEWPGRRWVFPIAVRRWSSPQPAAGRPET